jgi:hypothetical protein
VKRRLPLLALVAAGTWGCVYYNGLWSAHRYASDARHQERDGHPEAAMASWSQAALEAESVAARHPHSAWLPEALATAAEGLVGSHNCEAAAPYLDRIPGATKDSSILERAALLRAGCALTTGDLGAAERLAQPILTSKEQDRRNGAALVVGRAARRRASFDEAATAFARAPERAAGVERVLALVEGGRVEWADALCDTLVRLKPQEEDWDSVFAAFGRVAGPAVTSRIVGRVVPRSRLSAGARARLYLQDGFGLLASGDPAAADHRFLLAAQAAPDSGEADRAGVAHLQVRVAEVSSIDSILVIDAQLAPYVERGAGVDDARHLRGLLKRITADPDTTVTGVFRAGELARDSLYARTLAASLLLDFARRHPASVFAAKAIVAAIPLTPEHADSLTNELGARYAASPYSLALRGAPSPGFDAAEDSLARLFGLRGVTSAAQAVPRFAATWSPPQTGRRGPLLDPLEMAVARPRALKPAGSAPGRRGAVADSAP